MWVQFTNPKYPVLTHVIGAIAPSLVLPDPEERQKIFPFLHYLKLMWNFTGYAHIQGIIGDYRCKAQYLQEGWRVSSR